MSTRWGSSSAMGKPLEASRCLRAKELRKWWSTRSCQQVLYCASDAEPSHQGNWSIKHLGLSNFSPLVAMAQTSRNSRREWSNALWSKSSSCSQCAFANMRSRNNRVASPPRKKMPAELRVWKRGKSRMTSTGPVAPPAPAARSASERDTEPKQSRPGNWSGSAVKTHSYASKCRRSANQRFHALPIFALMLPPSAISLIAG
mmetsp:Transcript_117122/g.338613  ORF Transcript_117122/g.338613 Transcript_117122/m.338613 type:complete len:202 (-) Transcript_117122:150-755(-)